MKGTGSQSQKCVRNLYHTPCDATNCPGRVCFLQGMLTVSAMPLRFGMLFSALGASRLTCGGIPAPALSGVRLAMAGASCAVFSQRQLGDCLRCKSSRSRCVWAGELTRMDSSASIPLMAKAHKPSRGSSSRSKGTSRHSPKSMKKQNLSPPPPAQRGGVELDDPRESLLKARKAAPKADHIHYALAALDCLTGEADSALANLKVAIELKPENRFHARNDEDFGFLNEDPRFTELLYPEKDFG